MRRLLDPTLDVVFKLLLTTGPESTEVLCSLLTAVLRPSVPIAKVTVLDPEIPRDAVNDKAILLDVLCELEKGTRVDVEMQSDKRPAFRNRSLYYWARAFGMQLERGGEYQELLPVINVLFLDYAEVSARRLHSVYHLLEVHDHERYSDALEIHVIELPKLKGLSNDETQKEEALVRWCRFLAAETDAEIEEVAQMDPSIRAAQRALERLSADPDTQALARQRQLAMDTYRIEMAAARKEAREEGRAEGRAEGLEVGLAKGRAEGLEAGRQEGLEAGRLAEARAALRRVLARRGFELSKALSERIERCNELATLERWLDAAVVAASAEEALSP